MKDLQKHQLLNGQNLVLRQDENANHSVWIIDPDGLPGIVLHYGTAKERATDLFRSIRRKDLNERRAK
jgi:hypothetical protein